MATTAEPRSAGRQPPERPTADLAWLLSQASWVLTTELAAALEELGVSPRSFCVLRTALGGEFTQTELANAIGLDKTTMVVTIDELEAAGLAERRPAEEDRRARVIVVTPAGARAADRAGEIAARVQEDVLAALPKAQRAAFLDALARLVGGRLCEAADCAQKPRRRTPRAGG